MQSSNLQLGSQGAGLESDGVDMEGFNLFSHLRKKKLEGASSLVHDYQNLRMAVIELYLSVKIRSDDEIEDYCKETFEQEKIQMKDVDAYNIIDLIKSCVEQLMNLRDDESSVICGDVKINEDLIAESLPKRSKLKESSVLGT